MLCGYYFSFMGNEEANKPTSNQSASQPGGLKLSQVNGQQHGGWNLNFSRV